MVLRLIVVSAFLFFTAAAYADRAGRVLGDGYRERQTMNSNQGDTINPGANQAQQSQSSGAGANNAAGAALIAAGAALMSNPPTVPAGMALMAMGMLALMQGSHDSDAAGQSANTAWHSDQGGGSPTGTNPTNGSNPNGSGGFVNNPDYQKGVAAIEAAGGKVGKDGIMMPDGTQHPWSAFQSASALDSAGFDGAAIMGKVAEIEKGLEGAGRNVVSSMPTGAGGGYSAASYDEGSSDGDSAGRGPANFNPFALDSDAKARLIAGKTVQVGGELIGAKGDDIFMMVRRAYQRKSDSRQFILDESGIAPKNR